MLQADEEGKISLEVSMPNITQAGKAQTSPYLMPEMHISITMFYIDGFRTCFAAYLYIHTQYIIHGIQGGEDLLSDGEN